MDKSNSIRKLIQELDSQKKVMEAIRLLLENQDTRAALKIYEAYLKKWEKSLSELRAMESHEGAAPVKKLENKENLGEKFDRSVKKIGEAMLEPSESMDVLWVHRKKWLPAAFILLALALAYPAIRSALLSGHGLKGTYFADKDLKFPVLQRIDRELNFRWARRSPAKGIPPEEFSIRWEGFIRTTQKGPHEFGHYSDDGSRLWIDDVLIIDDWRPHSAELKKAILQLEPGLHSIKIEYFQGSAESAFRLLWRQPNSEFRSLVPASALFPVKP